MGQNRVISAMSMAILSEIEALLPGRGAEELKVAELKHLLESIGKSM